CIDVKEATPKEVKGKSPIRLDLLDTLSGDLIPTVNEDASLVHNSCFKLPDSKLG
ncbi:hypothetical protein HPP92_025994, partial [Vanilla planifolia]